jgi:hypothetical protein
MSWKPTIIAFTLAVIAVIAAILTGGDRAGTERASTRTTARPLLAANELPVDEVNRIVLTRGEHRYVLERGEEGRWMQIEPFTHPLERFAVRRLILAATEVEVIGTLAANGTAMPRESNTWALGDLALDPADARITYHWSGGELTLNLGRRTVAGRAYLQRPGRDGVFVVNQSLHRQAVELDPREWRDRTIFHGVGVAELNRIIRTVGETTLTIERDRRQWRITQPIQTRIDPQARDHVIQSLAAARAGGFIIDQPHDLSRFGLDPPLATIEVVTGEGGTDQTPTRQRLRIGSTAGAGTQDRFGYIEGRSTVIRIPARVLQTLLVHPSELADPTGSGVVAADVGAVRISGPAGEFMIRRELDRWIAVDHGNREVPRSVMDEFLSILTELRADDVALMQYPQELEVAHVTLLAADGRPRDTVRIIRDAESGQWALENGDNVLRIFSERLPLRLSPEEFGLSNGGA